VSGPRDAKGRQLALFEVSGATATLSADVWEPVEESDVLPVEDAAPRVRLVRYLPRLGFELRVGLADGGRP
jgi:hypothetical protein